MIHTTHNIVYHSIPWIIQTDLNETSQSIWYVNLWCKYTHHSNQITKHTKYKHLTKTQQRHYANWFHSFAFSSLPQVENTSQTWYLSTWYLTTWYLCTSGQAHDTSPHNTNQTRSLGNHSIPHHRTKKQLTASTPTTPILKTPQLQTKNHKPLRIT